MTINVQQCESESARLIKTLRHPLDCKLHYIMQMCRLNAALIVDYKLIVVGFDVTGLITTGPEETERVTY